MKPEMGDLEFTITEDNEWRYDPNRSIVRKRNGYCVDLDKCETSAQVLDHIFQVLGKTWCSEKTMRDLLLHLLYRINPQGNLCSWGVERGPVKLKDIKEFLG